MFDGEFCIAVENITVKFIPDEIISGRFNELQNKQEIIDQSDFSENSTCNTWTSEDGLTIYYYKVDAYLLIFSLGEFQPARYKFYLESVWRL
ncbi:hypothetical protein [Pedobacter sp. NJ-S-72]